MIDIKFVRENPGKIKKDLEKRGIKIDVDFFLDIDRQRREVMVALEDMRSKKNKASKEISLAKNSQEREKIILEMQELDKNNDNLEKNATELEEKFNSLMLQFPNLISDNTPDGKDEKGNVIVREQGEIPKFDFKPKDHLEIGELLDIIEVKRVAKVSGSRFGALKKEAVLMEFALTRFAIDTAEKEGFIPIIPPALIRAEAMGGMGYIDTPEDLEERYFLEKNKLFLVGTSEQSIGPLYQDEVFEEKELPKRFIAFSSCFREEAGSYGKDTRGILRVHQFDKLELFSFVNPEESTKEHQLMLSLEEKLMQGLKIPYRVVNLCSGDLSRVSSATYDIESFLPGENKYRETHSTSNCLDFQSRRLNIRYKLKDGKTALVHTLNGTALAIGRTIIAILENYQQKDGSVLIPEVLRPYMGGLSIILPEEKGTIK